MNTPNAKPMEDVSSLIRRPEYADRFKEVLRERAPQFISSVIQVGRAMGKDCDARSIIASAMTAAALDLPIDRNLGFAWIVPYKQNGVKYGQFQMGWKGFVQLAQRSGQYKNISIPRSINAEAFIGYDSIGMPMIDWNMVDESKEPVGYAFGWRLINGGESIFFWSIAKIKAHAERYSQAYRAGHDTPWKTHFPEMCRKTLVKNSLSQFGILSIQMQNAIQMDATVIKDVGSEPEYVDNAPKESKPDLPLLDVAKDEKDEPKAAPETSHTDQSDAAAALISQLEASGVEQDVFVNFINVNGIDRKHGFNASTAEGIQKWPREACLAIGSDAALMARAVKRFGKPMKAAVTD